MRIRFFILFLILPLLNPVLSAQSAGESPFRIIEIRTDTLVFSNIRNSVYVRDGMQQYFIYDQENEVAEIALFPKRNTTVQNLSLIPSGDYDLIDSLVFYNDAWRFKIQFKGLTRIQFLKLQLKYTSNNTEKLEIVRLLPCTRTVVELRPSGDELYIGEEKVFDLFTNNAENLSFSGEWVSDPGINYRIDRQNDQMRLHVVPSELGSQKLGIIFNTHKPSVDLESNRINTQLPPLEYTFSVKASRLKFLSIDRQDISLDEKSRTQGVEVQLDNNKLLQINKTYRVENQENPGGVLIAEIFTRSFLSNNKVLCYLKTYNYHRNSEGYLYIKDGDMPLFISNFNITPATSINKVTVIRDGSDWTSDLSVFPGETIGVRIEGQSLYKAKFHFEDLYDLTTDTLIQNENEVVLKLQVPLNINKKRINLYNYSSITGYMLTIREYESPRPFDYISINYGDQDRMLTDIHGPILYDKALRDVILTFNTDEIDSENKLYGRQYLTFDIRVTGSNNELVDLKTLSNVIVCPSDHSPRYDFYDKRNCSQNEISLNKHLRKNTNDLDDWSRVSVTVKTSPEKYGSESQQKEVEIILRKKYKFDIDVSFPAGLITVSEDSENPGQTTFSNLYGISMAMVAQFAFYNPEKIAKLRPYRIGAGFLALDAFNFQSERQDLALVALASLYPTTRNQKLAFPLYIGGGYQFKANKWMMLIGPGISIKL